MSKSNLPTTSLKGKEKKKALERGKQVLRKKAREKTNKEKDEIFAGYEELSRLSRGIMETEDDESNVEEEEEICFPSSWAKIAGNTEELQRKISEKLISEAKKKSKKAMKHCNPEGGNPNHSQSDGRFTSKGKAGSWSIKHPKTSKDCDAGTYRKTGSGDKKVWSKLPCGRDSDTNLCGTKDGVRKGRKSVKESDGFDSPELQLQSNLSDRLQRVLDKSPSFMQMLLFLIQPIVDAEQSNKIVNNHNVTDKQRENPSSERTEQRAELDEKKKNSPFRSHSPEEIRNVCKTRYNLMTFYEFLDLLQKIEAAKKGVQQKQT